jgi:hypothetical protein
VTHARRRASEQAVRHYASHADLLQPARPGYLPVDAIVVPAARPAANLESALLLAAALNTQVVVLCSRAARVEEVLRQADGIGGVRCTAVDLEVPTSPRDLGVPVDGLPELATSGFAEAPIPWHGDLSLKRNLGLVLGRRCGWRTVVFLDDDIRGLSPALVENAVGTLSHHAAAGMPATRAPDNSVVGHARRLAVGDQGVFVSGSALAVDVSRVDSFFPAIYNEDWLFLAPYLDRREVATVGSVRQDFQDPFEDLSRARDEEFGEVIGEGLIGWLHTGSLHSPLSERYWAEFLGQRAEFIETVALGCRLSDHPDAARAGVALEIAESARRELLPEVLAEYLAAWWADRDSWRQHLAQIEADDDLSAALDRLGLPADSVGPTCTAPRAGSS